MDNKSIHLSILDNSHAFFIEAVEKVISAQDETRNWQFAVLHLIQSLELTFKEALRIIHPVLIYEDVEKRKNTVSIRKALARIIDPEIGNITLTKDELRGIEYTIDLRNSFVHSDLILTPEYAKANFFVVFRLLVKIQRTIFDIDIRDILPNDLLTKIAVIEETKNLLRDTAIDLIDKIPNHAIKRWICPECLEDTFFAYLEEVEGNCLTCSNSEVLTICNYCQIPHFEDELSSFYQELDTDNFEGLETIHNGYGYNYHSACENCLPKILEDIEQQRMENNFYYHSTHR